jgi:hypothetical protein
MAFIHWFHPVLGSSSGLVNSSWRSNLSDSKIASKHQRDGNWKCPFRLLPNQTVTKLYYPVWGMSGPQPDRHNLVRSEKSSVRVLLNTEDEAETLELDVILSIFMNDWHSATEQKKSLLQHFLINLIILLYSRYWLFNSWNNNDLLYLVYQASTAKKVAPFK